MNLNSDFTENSQECFLTIMSCRKNTYVLPVYTRVDYTDKMIFQWETDFRGILIYENFFQCMELLQIQWF